MKNERADEIFKEITRIVCESITSQKHNDKDMTAVLSMTEEMYDTIRQHNKDAEAQPGLIKTNSPDAVCPIESRQMKFDVKDCQRCTFCEKYDRFENTVLCRKLYKAVPIDKDDHVMTLEKFIANVENGYLIDYDGSGSYANDFYVYPELTVMPSDVANGRINTSFTHVVWYNR